ncbi:DUF1707 SHOCT-like domain-containing protein [Corynebacterium pacaense]|uniref:DUF1707 SHOCT-like domain-containing protein n=1 Tax=Corynebacterium pacaense TaxID=1816684 RepID=UPI0009B97C0C|nr:DUF1707 domain-containing protein [Corynebacterium pacaense]
MNLPGHTPQPSDAEREALQADLTRLVGQGRLDLDTYQELVDIVWSTAQASDLNAIRGRYFGGVPQQMPPQQMPPRQMPPQQQGFPMGGHLPTPQNVEEKSTMGAIRRTGQWLVPAYSKYRLNGADLHLDLRRATAAAPVITFDITASMASMTIIVPPGVFVDVQMQNKNWSEFKIDTSAPAPNAPRVVITGISRGSTLRVITKSPDEPVGFWEQIFGG